MTKIINYIFDNIITYFFSPIFLSYAKSIVMESFKRLDLIRKWILQ